MDKIIKHLAKLEAMDWVLFFHVKRDGKYSIIKITVVDPRKSTASFYARNKNNHLIHVIRCQFWTNKISGKQKWYHDLTLASGLQRSHKLSEVEIINRLNKELARNRLKR